MNKVIPTIVHVAAYYPPHLGGMERVAKVAAELSATLGYRVQVITSNQSFYSKTTVENGVQVRRLASFEFAHTPVAPTLLWHLLRLPKNSIMHLHLSQAYYPELVLLVSKLRGIPYVAHFHLDVEPSGFFGALFVVYKKLVWGPVLRTATRVIACSSEQARVVADKFGVKKDSIVVMPNSVGDDFFATEPHTFTSTQARLLFVGRLALQKRVERLIDAVSKLTIPAHLTIVGDGEDRQKLESLVAKHGLTNVSFVGRKNDAQMQEYHKDSDIFLLSSDMEGGTPLVVLEAMAGGLPVIATDVSGVREFVDGVGVLVGEPYADNFAKTIDTLWQSKGKLEELAQKSRKKAADYTSTHFAKQLEEVYSHISI